MCSINNGYSLDILTSLVMIENMVGGRPGYKVERLNGGLHTHIRRLGTPMRISIIRNLYCHQ